MKPKAWEAKSLHDDRRVRADRVFEMINLHATVEDHEGWETIQGFGKENFPNEWSKKVFLKSDDDPAGPTTMAVFTVNFNKNSPVPVSAALNGEPLKLPK
jgi:hypothetical protein